MRLSYLIPIPGKDGFPWLLGVAVSVVVGVAVYAAVRPSSDAPETTASVLVSIPSPEDPQPAPPPKIVRPEIFTRLADRFGPVAAATIEPPPIPAAQAPAVPAATNPARCSRFSYLIARPKKEGLLDDMEVKYQKAFESQRRQAAAYHNCMRQVAPAKGG